MRMIVPGLILGLCLTACTPATQVTPAATTSVSPAVPAVASPSPEVPAPTLVWSGQVVEQTYLHPQGETLMTVRYSLPAAEQPEADPAWAMITDHYASLGQAYLNQASETASYAEADYDIAQTTDYRFLAYSEEATYEIAYQTENTVSFVRAFYSHTGGAYPSTFQFSEQFDLYSGDRLHFDDFFSDPDQARSRVLRFITDVTEGYEGYDGYYLDELETRFQEDNFYLTPEGYVFYFQEGDIGPHATGIPEFAIPYTDLSDLAIR